MRTFAYKAFITYSHEDSKAASWLQRKLETYRIPRGLTDEPSGNGNRPATLKPIFRDRDELSAGSDLTNAIDEALTQSEYLVVICSPAAARSRWTNLEISRFRKTHDDSKILCLIVGGEPFASSIPGREAEECFPPALGYSDQPGVEIDRSTIEPIAADLRPGKDGKNLAKLKIAAGLVGVGLDGLVRRDLQRRQWRLFGVAAASVTGMVVMAILSLIAIDARHDEQARRTEAEDLVEFMLSDLRERLEAVGRLDVLDAVGQETIEYYSKVTIDELPEDSLGRRARAFHLLGEVDDLRGDVDAARNAFKEAYRSTGELMERQPANGERVFNHAQSVFWVGYLDFRLGNFDQAEAAFNEYIALAGQLVKIDPANMDWLAELGYASINMGAYLLETGSAAAAIEYFERGQDVFEKVTRIDPGNTDWQVTLAQAHAWAADANRDAGMLREARDHRRIEARIYQEILSRDPENQDVRQTLLVSHKARAQLSMYQGDVKAAAEDYAQAKIYGDSLLRLDPENTLTALLAVTVDIEYAEALAIGRDSVRAADLLASASRRTDALLATDPSVLEWQLAAHEITITAAHLARGSNDDNGVVPALAASIVELDRLLEENPRSKRTRYLLADALLATSQLYGDADASELRARSLQRAIEQLLPYRDELPTLQVALLARAYADAGNRTESEVLSQELSRIGFKHPRYAEPEM